MKPKVLIAVALMAAAPAFAQPQAWAWDDGTVPYVQTPMEIVERMLRMAEVKKDDYVIDLGSGDGRIIIEAAKRGARGLGVDLDANLVKLADREREDRPESTTELSFRREDIFETDLSRRDGRRVLPAARTSTPSCCRGCSSSSRARASCRTTAASATGRPTSASRCARRRSRSASAACRASSCGSCRPTPRVPGRARFPGTAASWRFQIKQKYQELDIDVAAQGRDLLVRNSRLRGEEIKLIVTGIVNGRAWHHYFVGTLRDDRISRRGHRFRRQQQEELSLDGNQNKVAPKQLLSRRRRHRPDHAAW